MGCHRFGLYPWNFGHGHCGKVLATALFYYSKTSGGEAPTLLAIGYKTRGLKYLHHPSNNVMIHHW